LIKNLKQVKNLNQKLMKKIWVLWSWKRENSKNLSA